MYLRLSLTLSLSHTSIRLNMAMVAALLILVVAAATASADQHTVGGSAGWTQGVVYSVWADGETFKVGDTLCKFISNNDFHALIISDYTLLFLFYYVKLPKYLFYIVKNI